MSDRIFINYRRGNDSGFAQALFLTLRHAFPSDALFMDVDSIEPGVDFVSLLESQIAECTVVLALIGSGWADAADAAGNRRLDDAEDFVRIELSSALKQGKRVIPILLPGAVMPRSEQLPEDLKALTRRQAVRLNHERFGSNAQGLIASLRHALGYAASEAQVGEANPVSSAQTTGPIPSSASGVGNSLETAPAEARGLPVWIEEIADRCGVFNIAVMSLFSAVLLVFGSYMAGVIDLNYKGKQVGFIWAPNWSINYLVLFGIYNALYCSFAAKINDIFERFCAAKIIIQDNGQPCPPHQIRLAWQKYLRNISGVLWVLLTAIPIMAVLTWFEVCYQPLLHNDLGTRPVDWGNIVLVDPTATSKNTEIIFTFVAYLYMGFSILIYLFILAYAAAFAGFLNGLSRGFAGFRLILVDKIFEEVLQDVLQRILVFTFLGFIAAYLMRLQAAYLQAPENNVLQFLFSAEWRLLLPNNAGIGDLSSGRLAPATWAAWLIFIYAAVIFGLSLSLLRATYHNARDYFIAHNAAELQPSENKARLAEDRFFKLAVPYFGHHLVAFVLMLVSVAVPSLGLVFIVGILCTLSPIALRRLRRTN